MSKHTPGPWRMTLDDFGDYTIQPHDAELAIAAVVNGEMRRMGGQAGEHAANARVIMAAPEMVKALQRIAAGRFMNPQGHQQRYSREAMMQIAREAMAPLGVPFHLSQIDEAEDVAGGLP